MFSVIFEVLPHKERFDDYLALARRLKPILQGIDGFIDNERFESKQRAGLLLSHSTWRDEKAVVRWRTEGEHHAVQSKGRFEILSDYHLRVGDVTSDTHPPRDMPVSEKRFDETEIGLAKLVSLIEITPKDAGAPAVPPELLPARIGLDLSGKTVAEHDVFASIYNPGKLALLVAWKNAELGRAWRPKSLDDVRDMRHRTVRIVRDYGMFDRREAPQYYKPVEKRDKIDA